MFRTARWFLAVESFRSESGRGVLRELYASFVMVTATRLMTNEIDGEINASPDGRPPKRVNFKHAVAAVFRNFEALALVRADAVAETVARIVDDVAALRQRERPGRSHPGVSRKPKGKWSRKGKVAAAGRTCRPRHETGLPVQDLPRPVKSTAPIPQVSAIGWPVGDSGGILRRLRS